MRSLVFFAVCLLVLVAGCSHSPRMIRHTPDVDVYRAEFLRNNPDGKYNQNIVKGEVSKGMTVLEVIASWGLPHVRRGAKPSDTESWTYYTIDEHTHKVVSYELVFVSDQLNRWVIDENVPGQGTLTPKDLIGIPTVGETPIGGLVDTPPDSEGKKKR